MRLNILQEKRSSGQGNAIYGRCLGLFLLAGEKCLSWHPDPSDVLQTLKLAKPRKSMKIAVKHTLSVPALRSLLFSS
jgi:hypothetical protein